MGSVGIRQALQEVADKPESEVPPIEMKVHELIARTLFEIANTPNAKVRGSMARATRAQKIIANRLVGTRRPGSAPAGQPTSGIEFVDLTQGVIDV